LLLSAFTAFPLLVFIAGVIYRRTVSEGPPTLPEGGLVLTHEGGGRYALEGVGTLRVEGDWQRASARAGGASFRFAGSSPWSFRLNATANDAAGSLTGGYQHRGRVLRWGGRELQLRRASLWPTLGWRALVAWMLVTPQRESRKKNYAGLGWFDRMPGTPAGAIAARSITYWLRDARYHTSLVAIPVAPIVFVVALSVAGVPWNVLALIPVPAMCLFLSWSIHNDIAYDNTAIWLHVASNVSGQADRLGRVVPALVIGVPLVFIGSPIAASLYGDWAVLPSLIGVSSCILLAGLGFSSVISARFPYPSVRPGDSPFNQPQASGTAAGLIQSLSFFAAIVVSVPTLAFAALGLFVNPAWHVGSLVAGLLIGLAALVLGILGGGAIFSRRGPELLAFTMKN
jgi:ABC-2 type transport system permease protein